MALHEKIDSLREKQWSELIAMQQEQLRLISQFKAIVQDQDKQQVSREG